MSGRLDMAVVGSGPGGYAAALAAARRGLRVGLIERERWGGVCLNVGCIPTKALVAVAQTIRRIRQAPSLGITISGYALDYALVRARNDRIVTTLRRGLTDLLRRERVELIDGSAAFEGPHQLVVTQDGSSRIIDAERIILAAGARPSSGPWTFDERQVMSYRGLLSSSQRPASLLIIGGGVIGCEFASIFSEFGSQVTLVEQQAQLLPLEDPDAARWLTRRFEADGITVLTQTTVQRLDVSAEAVTATLTDGTSRTVEQVLIAIGQRPHIEPLRLDAAAVASARGIRVDETLRTSQPHIAAIGDCVEGHGLAHWASAEGALAVHNLLEDAPESIDPLDVPRCIFTSPEIAHIGPLESQVRETVSVSRCAFGALGKSHCDEETEGFLKLLVDRATDQVRGATIVSAHASSLIHHAVLAIRHKLTAKQLARTITAHPTLPEAITEAAAHLYGESLVLAARSRNRSAV